MNRSNLADISVIDDEPFAIWMLNIVYGQVIHKSPGKIFDQDINTVYMDRLFVFFWLIQSRPNIGSPSAHSLDKQAKIFTSILVEYLLEFLLCHVSYLYHTLP